MSIAIPTPKLWQRVLARLLYLLLRAFQRTWTVERSGWGEFQDRLREGKPSLVVFWHGSYVPLFALLSDLGGCVFTNDSNRGQVIALVCSHFGYSPVQLATASRDTARTTMAEAMAKQTLVGIALDGPTGPFHTVKLGALELSSRLGFDVVPVNVTVQPRLVLGGRWDRLEIPVPFSRVRLHIGDPLAPPLSGRHERSFDFGQRVRRQLERMQVDWTGIESS